MEKCGGFLQKMEKCGGWFFVNNCGGGFCRWRSAIGRDQMGGFVWGGFCRWSSAIGRDQMGGFVQGRRFVMFADLCNVHVSSLLDLFVSSFSSKSQEQNKELYRSFHDSEFGQPSGEIFSYARNSMASSFRCRHYLDPHSTSW